MAGKFSGRVFAGEDSEEESEEESEIQYNFQFSSLAAPAPTAAAVAAPRFSVPTPVSAGGEGSEEDESDEDALPPPISTAPKAIVMAPVAAGGEDSEEDDDDDGEDAQAFVGLKQSASSEMRSAESRSPAAQQTVVTPTAKVTTAAAAEAAGRVVVTPPPAAPQLRLSEQPQKQGIEDDDAHWRLGDGIDGVHVMGDAIVTRLQPSLDDSITRIAELTESQQELLQLLASQHAGICANEQIKKVAVVMDKLPHYIRKIQDIKAAMAEISASVEKMKKRGESLRVDAQSHALKKESKRDSMAQWNKLHAARSSEQQSAK